MANIEIAIKCYNNNDIIFVFKNGNRLSLEEMIEYKKDHFVVIV